MVIKIERGTTADVDALEQLYYDINEALEAGVNYPGWQKGVYPQRQDAIEGIEENSLFVARMDGRIVGSVILNHKAEHGYERAGWRYKGDDQTILVIHTLAVHPGCAKQGIGRQLLDFAETFGVENNMKSIRLDVFVNNAPAMRLYEKCGYHYIDTVDLGLGEYGLDAFRLYEKLL